MEQKKPAYVKNVKKLETKAALEQKYQMELEKLEREIETENVQQLILQLRELVTWAETLTEQQSDRNWEKLAESNDNSKVAMCHSRKKVKELKTIPGDKLGEFLCSFLKIYFLIRLVQDLYRLWMKIFNFHVARNCDKQYSENWKSVISASVDHAPATQECKMLQLCHYFCGDALKTVEDLGILDMQTKQLKSI